MYIYIYIYYIYLTVLLNDCLGHHQIVRDIDRWFTKMFFLRLRAANKTQFTVVIAVINQMESGNGPRDHQNSNNPIKNRYTCFLIKTII